MTQVTTQESSNPWRRGLPPGRVTPQMIEDFEVSYTILGGPWHRRRTQGAPNADTYALSSRPEEI
jgi:hypothetical protein